MIHLDLPLQQLPQNTKRLFLAFSGGIDSSVLLHALRAFKSQFIIQLWHINHGLQKNASRMEEFARAQALHYGLDFRLDHLHMDASAGNLEAKARERRYALFAQALHRGDVLLTAHHQNDQAETLLLNLMRGSGSAGLRAIARQRSLGEGTLFRPLLDFSRSKIEQYAAAHHLEWIEDPSNQNIDFDRNYLRHQVFPQILQRWPSALEQFHRVSELQNETEQLIVDLAELDYKASARPAKGTAYACLCVEALSSLSLFRRKNLIRYWIRHHGLSVIGFHRLEELVRQLDSRIDACPLIEGTGFAIRRYRKCIYLIPEKVKPVLSACYEVPGSGSLIIASIGFNQSRTSLFDYLKQKDQGQRLAICFRQDSQYGLPVLHSHRLKRLFQKHQIPPWMRSTVPQIYVENELVALWLHH